MTVHDMAKAGFGEGTNELYDRARPTYPSEAIGAIRKVLKNSPPLEMVELGAGTGIFTRALLAHPDFSESIGHIKAIEPSSGMRNQFEKQTPDARVSIQNGTFQDIPIDAASADLVVVAQAWHWAHPDYDKAIKEIARVLKPNGTAFFIWNLEDRDGSQWVRDIRDAYEPFEKGTPQFRLELWRETFKTDSYQTYFEKEQELTFNHLVTTTEQGVIDRVNSKSYITQLSEDEKKKLNGRIREAIFNDQNKEWIDQDNGIFKYPYKTYLVVMHKKHSN